MWSREKALKVLGLGPGSSRTDIKRAYRALAAKWHPDQFTGDETRRRLAEEKLKQINAARDYLFGLEEDRASAEPTAPKPPQASRTRAKYSPPPPPPPPPTPKRPPRKRRDWRSSVRTKARSAGRAIATGLLWSLYWLLRVVVACAIVYVSWWLFQPNPKTASPPTTAYLDTPQTPTVEETDPLPDETEVTDTSTSDVTSMTQEEDSRVEDAEDPDLNPPIFDEFDETHDRDPIFEDEDSGLDGGEFDDPVDEGDL